jgi:hypothetical protein
LCKLELPSAVFGTEKRLYRNSTANFDDISSSSSSVAAATAAAAESGLRKLFVQKRPWRPATPAGAKARQNPLRKGSSRTFHNSFQFRYARVDRDSAASLRGRGFYFASSVEAVFFFFIFFFLPYDDQG